MPSDRAEPFSEQLTVERIKICKCGECPWS